MGKWKNKGKRQKPYPKNAKRNERRNKRLGMIKDFLWEQRNALRCQVCGCKQPLVFYGLNKDLSIDKVLEGNKTLRTVKHKLEKLPVLCLNHANLKRKQENEARFKQSAIQSTRPTNNTQRNQKVK